MTQFKPIAPRRPTLKSKASASPRAAIPPEPDASSAASPSPFAAAGASAAPTIDADQRRAMIAEAAYYLAEKRGFAPGHELEDWCLAERRVAAVIDE